MCEYKYVYLDTGRGMLSGSLRSSSGKHRKLIGQYAGEGWRYVGFLPTGFTGHGGISSVNLVFKRGQTKCEK